MKRGALICLCAWFLGTSALHAEDGLDHGLWWLYQLQYDKARSEIETYTQAHPKDPAGYFYLTAIDWWHLAQDIEYSLPDVRKQLEADSQRTIQVANALYGSSTDKHSKAQACLYRGGAEGLWGRWLVTRRDWVKAYFAGKRGHNWLKKSLDLDPSLYDAYLGLGIYDYYTDTLSGVQAALAALLIHGDRVRGLKELHLAIDKSPHARVEAMCFLVEIYASEENMPKEALPIAASLHKEFPQSPGMHLIYMSTLYSMKAWDSVLLESTDFLKKAESETPWYSHRYISPGRYCLGVAKLFGKHDSDGALEQMEKILTDDKDESRWVSFAYLRRGEIHDLHDEREKALADYNRALKGPDIWGLHAEARHHLKTPFKF